MPTPSVLKSAYRTHALRYHPDRNSGAHDAEEAFKKVGEAYCLLQKYCKDAA
jgi:molecular chaperone DnaJ